MDLKGQGGDAWCDRQPSNTAGSYVRGKNSGLNGGVKGGHRGGGSGSQQGGSRGRELDGKAAKADAGNGEATLIVGGDSRHFDGGSGRAGRGLYGTDRERGRVISPWPGGNVFLMQLEQADVVCFNEGVSILAVERVHIHHHLGWSVEAGECISEDLLSVAAYHINGSSVFQNLSDGGTVTEVIEMDSPDVFAAFLECPAHSSSFPYKTVTISLSILTWSGAEPDWAEAWS